MATVPPAKHHHQPLHNFSLPFLKWGHRIQLNNHRRRNHHRTSPLTVTDDSDSDLNHRTKPRRFFRHTTKPKHDAENASVLPETRIAVDAATADDGDVKPWNLRPRRLTIDAVDGNSTAAAVTGSKSGRLLRGGATAEEENEENGKKRRLWISLSKEEIEEDVYAFTGSRPARRPKKRNRTAQKHVDNVFPGLYLVGASADSYRV